MDFGSSGHERNESGPSNGEPTTSNHVEPTTSKQKGNRGLRTNYKALDEKVWQWFQNSIKNNVNRTKCDVQNYARTVYFNANMNTFKASDGWYRRWRHRWVENGDVKKMKAEAQDADSKKEIINFEFPVFDENLFSIGKPDSFLESLGNFEKKRPKREYRGKRQAPIKTKVPVSTKENSRTDKKYRPEFKEKVVTYTATHSFLDSAKKFGIHQTTVSRWSKERESVPLIQNLWVDSDVCGAETDLAEWLRQIRLSGKRVTKTDVQEEVKKIRERMNCNLSKWFSLYYSRLFDGDSKAIIQYPQVVKTEVVKLADTLSQKSVASILNISRKQIYNWSKESLPENAITKISGKLDDVGKCLWKWYVARNLKPSKKELLRQAAEIAWKKEYDVTVTNYWFRKWCSHYEVASNSILDKLLLEWILKKFDHNVTPTYGNIRKKCAALHKSIYGETSFKSSTGWVVRFCGRYSDLLQKTPSPNTCLPRRCEFHKKNFRETLIKMISENSIKLDRIGIVDESALRFSIPSKKIKRCLRMCGFKNIEGSFVVSCTANGTILPLLLILKGTRSEPDMVRISDDIIVTYEESGALNSTIMNFWVDRVWMSRSSSPNVLILDCFQPHKDPSVKEKFAQRKSSLAYIPAGCGSHFVWILSDICEFVSENVNQKWQQWLNNGPKLFYDDSESFSEKSPSESDVISWIRAAFVEAKTKFQTSVANNFRQLITVDKCFDQS